ncbi:IS3 family transposase [Mesorhizobium sp.]|uniref:IS3 family transposase n=1 Tax=Mesorhizobium sp. TaxID=1871066 RepID=UPI0025BACDFC|nr:IS3 family transposase [Mesorhizobium sp.]
MSIERMCTLASVSRAGYYRHLQASAPRQEETYVRDAIQRIALANRFSYGYRRITWQLRREGLVVNHKRVLRLMGEDNLLCLRKGRSCRSRPRLVIAGRWCRTWPAALS